MTNDFHFDTEIIIKLHHERMKIMEVAIPTFYGTELCRVDGMRYAKDVVRSVWRYKETVRSVRRAPEFAEYFVHYPIKRSRRSSHDYVLRMTGTGKRVLDIACGEGFFAEELARNGNHVVGVDALAAPKNAAVMDQYIRMDLTQPAGLSAAVEGQHFDHVLLLDILEHLPQPERLLAEARAAAGPKGQIVVSVPNVANLTVRLALLFGRFEYADRGIMDRTHLRFFTHRSARRLLERNGLEIIASRTTVVPLELVVGLSRNNPLMRILNISLSIVTAIFPGFLGYQCLFWARPRN
jgi:2-polyprenyl-3-methyl-5-hydroxy-6-metoxy-1,4-benzoquinol methylase